MQICPSNKCTSCAACENVCPHNCISMQEDSYGELHPVIDQDKCKNCNLCAKICPVNNQLQFNYPIGCYASWITDNNKRRICASGGIGTIMSEYVIEQQKGIVFGSRYDKDFKPIMTYTDNSVELEKFKGSRYVQSVVGAETYKDVHNSLKADKKVMFVGTPCQIAGLKSFLRKDYDNLITVDLICHGVCPTRYFTDEVNLIRKNKGIKELDDIRFRGNDENNYCFSFWTKHNCVYRERAFESYYLNGFLLGVSLRGNCFSCSYARPERISDITIGDFIGLGKNEPFAYPINNVSSVLINTEKGSEFYKELSSKTPDLMNVERSYAERLEYKPSLVEPFAKHELNSVFREQYPQMGFVKAIRKTLGRLVKKAKYKKFVSLPLRVARKVWRMIKK